MYGAMQKDTVFQHHKANYLQCGPDLTDTDSYSSGQTLD